MIFRVPILHLFTNDLSVVKEAFIPMTILSVCILFQIPQVITIGSLRGAGDVKFVASLMFVSVTCAPTSFALFVDIPILVFYDATNFLATNSKRITD